MWVIASALHLPASPRSSGRGSSRKCSCCWGLGGSTVTARCARLVLDRLERATRKGRKPHGLLPPLDYALSLVVAASRAGSVNLLRVRGGRFASGGNVFATGALDNIFGALDFFGRIAVHGQKNPTLLQPALVALGFKFGDAHSDQCASDSTNCASDAQSSKPSHDRTGGNERTEARNCEQADARKHTQRSTDHSSGSHASRRAFRCFGGLLGAHILLWS